MSERNGLKSVPRFSLVRNKVGLSKSGLSSYRRFPLVCRVVAWVFLMELPGWLPSTAGGLHWFRLSGIRLVFPGRVPEGGRGLYEYTLCKHRDKTGFAQHVGDKAA